MIILYLEYGTETPISRDTTHSITFDGYFTQMISFAVSAFNCGSICYYYCCCILLLLLLLLFLLLFARLFSWSSFFPLLKKKSIRFSSSRLNVCWTCTYPFRSVVFGRCLPRLRLASPNAKALLLLSSRWNGLWSPGPWILWLLYCGIFILL